MIRIGHRAGAAELFEHEKTAPLGHHHVEDDQIGVFAFGQGQALVSVASDENFVASPLQGNPHGLDDLAIIVDQQDPLAGFCGIFYRSSRRP